MDTAAKSHTRSATGFWLVALILLAAATAGGFWWWNQRPNGTAPVTTTERKQLYQCPMHPQVIKDHPGKCDFCGMDLVPVAADPGMPGAGGEPVTLIEGRAPVMIAPERLQGFGIQTAPVEERTLTEDVRAVGQVVPDEAKLFQVRTKIEGFVERLVVNQTNQFVTAGQPMLEVYSPEVVSAEEEYLNAVELAKQTASSPFPEIRQNSEALVQAARRRLALWDIPQAEVERLTATHQVRRTVTLQMPYTGHVHELSVKVGDRIDPSMTLYVIADFSTVWVHAQVYEHDLGKIYEGQTARITLGALPGQQFTGRVDFIWPHVETATRTTTVRIVVKNPGHILKAGMFGDAVLVGRPQRLLTVPKEAVVDTGRRTLVFVQVEPGRFEPRQITLGREMDEYFEVVSGLTAGEQVVTEGNYMVDSDSRIRGTALGAGLGAGSMPGMDMGPSGAPQSGGTMPGMDMSAPAPQSSAGHPH